ncbi:MAG: MBL fold metallo-hydrolase [Xanthomonadales bacterium]|nr:MBL fold metallo-hydrolase [Xanthomonadales bacterium]
MKRFLIAMCCLSAVVAHGQELATSFESTEVAPGIIMVSGVGGFGGGNMAILVGDTHVAMIDDSMRPLAPTLLAHVAETAGRPINFMINTHVHGDHVGGNASFAEGGTVVFAHENIRKRLISDPGPAGGEAGLPVVTYADGVTFHLDDLEARVIHVPSAHTDGDSIIHFPSANVIHTGDLLFSGMFPFIDLDSGGSVSGYIAGQEKIWSMADDETKIISGHGGLASKSSLRADIEMLKDSYALVKELVDAGQSEADIVSANPLSRYHDTYDWAFITTERMTRTLVRDLTQNR